jgi:GNAT superfamily N-acetyltransferase
LDETDELVGLCIRACVTMMSEAPALELRMRQNCVLALTGEPVADLNMLFVGPNPDAEAFLTEAMVRVNERGLPLLAMMSPHVARTLAPAAERLGLAAAGTAPLMTLRSETPVRPSRPCDIRRALGAELVGIAGDLVSAAFSLPRDAVARSMDVAITETSGLETYVAWGEAGPMSAVSVTPAGTTAGIWSMATPPEHQGKGVGRALLTGVIDDYRRRGVERFFLIATEAGRPLYASLGFEVVAELSAWVLGHSTQMHG